MCSSDLEDGARPLQSLELLPHRIARAVALPAVFREQDALGKALRVGEMRRRCAQVLAQQQVDVRLLVRHINVIGYHIEAKPKDGEALASNTKANPAFPNVVPGVVFAGYKTPFTWNNVSPRAGVTYALDAASKTVARVGATRMMVAKISCMAALWPMMFSNL